MAPSLGDRQVQDKSFNHKKGTISGGDQHWQRSLWASPNDRPLSLTSSPPAAGTRWLQARLARTGPWLTSKGFAVWFRSWVQKGGDTVSLKPINGVTRNTFPSTLFADDTRRKKKNIEKWFWTRIHAAIAEVRERFIRLQSCGELQCNIMSTELSAAAAAAALSLSHHLYVGYDSVASLCCALVRLLSFAVRLCIFVFFCKSFRLLVHLVFFDLSFSHFPSLNSLLSFQLL